MAYVYRHIRLDKNEVFYIGISNEINENFKRAYCKQRRNNHWNNIVNKSEYKVDILFYNVTWEFAKQKEIELIELYAKKIDNSGSLCNITNGGEGTLGLKWSKERRDKILQAITGRKRTNEQKERISKSRVGNILSENHRFNISKTLKNKKWSVEELNSKKNASSKIVINEQSGIFYSSAKEAAIAHNINNSTLYNKLIGLRKNNTYLRYIN